MKPKPVPSGFGSAPVKTSVLGRAVARGLGFLMLQSLAGRVISFVGQIALGWLLVPADFGVISLALVATSLAGVFGGAVDDVIIQRGSRIRFWLRPAFLLSVGVSAILAAALVLVSPLAAIVFRTPELVGIIAILALSVPLTAMSVVPMAQLRAEMRFGELAGFGTFELVFVQVLSVLFAYLGLGPYALALPMTLAAALRAAYFLRLVPVRSASTRGRRRSRHLVRNSATVSTTRLLTTLIAHGDYLMIGLLTSPATLGIYYFAYKIAVQPLSILAGNITGVLFPALSGLSHDPVRQSAAAISAYKILSHLIFPMSLLQAVVARPLLEFAFGSKWEGAIVLVQILSLGLAFEALLWIAGAYLGARGQFGRVNVYAALNAFGFYISVAVGTYAYGSVGTAIAISLFFLLASPIEFVTVFRRPQWLRELSDVYARPLAMSVIAALVAFWAERWTSATGGRLAGTAIALLVGSLVYGLLVRSTDRALWTDLTSRIRDVIAARRGSPG